MRMLMQVLIPPEPFNTLLKSGVAGQKLNQIVSDIKPEAVYFSEWGGQRCALLVVDVPDASRVPALGEPFFITFNARVELHVAMTAEDLAKADLAALGKKYG